jgi:hypothetical protein
MKGGYQSSSLLIARDRMLGWLARGGRGAWPLLVLRLLVQQGHQLLIGTITVGVLDVLEQMLVCWSRRPDMILPGQAEETFVPSLGIICWINNVQFEHGAQEEAGIVADFIFRKRTVLQSFPAQNNIVVFSILLKTSTWKNAVFTLKFFEVPVKGQSHEISKIIWRPRMKDGYLKNNFFIVFNFFDCPFNILFDIIVLIYFKHISNTKLGDFFSKRSFNRRQSELGIQRLFNPL